MTAHLSPALIAPDGAADLPIAAVLPRLSDALARGHAVLTAPTGSGKTTAVPLALLRAPWLTSRHILMLEPRRPAARLAAARMAALLGEDVGGQVGHQVRFERCIGPRTRLRVLTEGILTRRIQADPELTGCGLVIFDELHERSLNADLALALTLDATTLRPDLRILVMSATLDAAAVAELLGGAPVIRADGRSHPVAVHYAERMPPDPVDAVAATVPIALAEQPGDVLAFLPGAAEIERVSRQLAARLPATDEVEVLALHGALSLSEQDRALRPTGERARRIVLATDLAETSLTIEGIGAVIDSGLTRKPRFEPGPGLTRLITQPISRASAEQRSGRAGRLGPGMCWRLWTAEQHRHRPSYRPAEILQADMAPVALELALWGVTDPNALAWMDPPPAAAWAQGVDLLRDLGALDGSGAITALGQRMAALPLHPRLARLLVEAPAGARAIATDLAALLEERDPWTGRSGEFRPADLGERLAALAASRAGRRIDGFDARRLRTIERLSRLYHRLLRDVDADSPARDGTPVEDLSPGALLALAYPDRIAQNRGGTGERLLLANGGGAVLPRDDALRTAPYLVIADLQASSGDHRIRAALPVAEQDLRALVAERIAEGATLDWDMRLQAVTAREEVRLGAIRLEAHTVPVHDLDAALALLLTAIRRDLGRTLDWTPAARQLQARVMLARHVQPDAGWPDLSNETLALSVEHWLAPWLAGATRLAEARALDLTDVLKQTLGWENASRLDRLAPETVTTPAGSRHRIDYRDALDAEPPAPVLAVPMQELFGSTDTPAIFDDRLPLLLHLLSPAGRPLQITRDLAAFWRGAYPDVRKEMRGRYPKHHWPEDPTASPPVRGGLKRHLRG